MGRRIRTHLATMTGVLRRLEAGGWVGRQPDATDERMGAEVRIQPLSHHRPSNLDTCIEQKPDSSLAAVI
ncbi:MarR family transcriptional regulator [uncultured Actinomyces sp.]|uniref:MarR family transcriptional regulator n=1 Tax=Actinomyces sp. oral taxon 448 TaxID=712124 RepID=UPI0012EA4058